MQEFKKTFNEEKLNAPQADEFADMSEYPDKNKATNKSSKKQLNTSTDSTGSERSSPRKSESRMNYEGLEKLIGAPRVNDQIAFQILEISSNFTPEVSEYKVWLFVCGFLFVIMFFHNFFDYIIQDGNSRWVRWSHEWDHTRVEYEVQSGAEEIE